MTYTVRYTQGALDDLDRLFDYLLLRDIALAERAYKAIEKATGLLADFPFSCRKASSENPFLRELLIPFGSAVTCCSLKSTMTRPLPFSPSVISGKTTIIDGERYRSLVSHLGLIQGS